MYTAVCEIITFIHVHVHQRAGSTDENDFFLKWLEMHLNHMTENYNL